MGPFQVAAPSTHARGLDVPGPLLVKVAKRQGVSSWRRAYRAHWLAPDATDVAVQRVLEGHTC
jgi:hypothetical protein